MDIAKRHCRRAASTKTRIETSKVAAIVVFGRGRRAASTKTRIETAEIEKYTKEVKKVAGRHPLKQGLKHIIVPCPNNCIRVAGRHPLKQGLKHKNHAAHWVRWFVSQGGIH